MQLHIINNRGYTGHEHLDMFKLINGRMYDPIIGKMLSPDNFVQSPEFSQSYNRYAYCFNNPIKYTDPSGYVITNGGTGTHDDPLQLNEVDVYAYGPPLPRDFIAWFRSN